MKGLHIRLLKRNVPNLGSHNNRDFHFICWSYFDGIHISKVKKLQDYYRPPKEAHLLYERQHVYLYEFEESEDQTIISEENEIYSNPEYNSAYPLIALTKLKINDQLLLDRDIKGIYKDIENTIIKLMENKNFDFKYKVYGVLGSSDVAIIFRTFSYSIIIHILESLRGMVYQSETSPKDYFISSYSTLGVSREIDEKGYNVWNEAEKDSNISVSIRVTCKPNAKSLKRISDEIARKIGVLKLKIRQSKKPKVKSMDKLSLKPTGEFGKKQISGLRSTQIVFGKYDIEFDLKHTPQTITKLFTDEDENGILNPNSSFYRENIYSTHTRWNLRDDSKWSIFNDGFANKLNEDNVDSNSSVKATDNPLNTEIGTNSSNAIEIYKKYNEDIESYSSSISEQMQGALRELVMYYLKISHTIFTEGICSDLHDIFSVFMELVGNNCKVVSQDSKTKFEHESLQIGIKTLAELISNRVQASRLNFEAPYYNLKFMGSPAKIFMAYSAMIRLLINELFEGKDEKFLFFATVDLSNQLSSLLYFKNVPSSKKLVSINFTNNEFFRFNEAIPYIFHEISHYISIDDNRHRNYAFLDAVSRYLAFIILEKLKRHSIFEYINNYSSSTLSSKTLDKFKGTSKNAEEKLGDSFNTSIKCILLGIPNTDRENQFRNSTKTSFKGFVKILFDNLVIFIRPDKDNDYRIDHLHTIYINTVDSLINELCNLFGSTHQINKNIASHTYAIIRNADNKENIIPKGSFSNYIKQIVFNEVVDKEDNYNLIAYFSSIMDGYQEAYADFLMVELLGLDFKDYIKVIVKYFENLRIDFDKVDVANAIRIRAVLGYLIDKEFSKNTKRMGEQFKGVCADNNCTYIIDMYKDIKITKLTEPIIKYFNESLSKELEAFKVKKNIKKISEYYKIIRENHEDNRNNTNEINMIIEYWQEWIRINLNNSTNSNA